MDNFKRIMDEEFKVSVIGDGIIKASVLFPMFILLFLFSTFFSYETNLTTSMYPTIEEGSGLLISRNVEDINRGDIISFEGPTKRSHYVKRVLALPGETLTIVDHKIYIDGEFYDDPHKRDGEYSYDMEVTLADDEYFVVGDNRYISEDSRDYGPIKEDIIKGKVIHIINIAKAFGYGTSSAESTSDEMHQIPAEFR